MSYTYLQAFLSSNEFNQYGSNAHLIYAICLREQIEDVHNLVATSLTDGNDDKKADLVYIDEDKGVAIIAQGYYSSRHRQSAPSNKASDLNTAASWLLARELEDLPEQIKPKAIELREAISNGIIKRIEFWYVHNLNQSDNVKNEMRAVEHSAKGLVTTYFSGLNGIEIVGLEVGNETIEEWYLDSEARISVVDDYILEADKGFVIESENWKAFVTFVPGSWIRDLYAIHDRKLFSANIRDYLGHRRSDKNINHRIQQTATFDSNNFWVYNNGMTALVNNFEPLPDGMLKIEGISIVNGAQTTGAIGKLAASPNDDLLVPIRFIMCDSKETVKKIIKYNNSQNKIEATDFRSNDVTQRRLRQEFSSLSDVFYDGGRRLDNNPSQYGVDYLSSYTVAQALTAFYGDPISAANKKSDIWVNDDLYGNIFKDGTNARNIIFVYSLFKTIEYVKIELSEKSSLTDEEVNHLNFLRFRKSFYLLCNAISSVMEQILGNPIPNKMLLGFSENVKPSDAIELWSPVVKTALKFSRPLRTIMENGFSNQDNINEGVEQFKAQLSAFLDVTREGVNTFNDSVLDRTTV
ncbi:AIPR family protein [Cytobacillus firmus]|nr:AIPR family protein [Cytobacillus firmus]